MYTVQGEITFTTTSRRLPVCILDSELLVVTCTPDFAREWENHLARPVLVGATLKDLVPERAYHEIVKAYKSLHGEGALVGQVGSATRRLEFTLHRFPNHTVSITLSPRTPTGDLTRATLLRTFTHTPSLASPERYAGVAQATLDEFPQSTVTILSLDETVSTATVVYTSENEQRSAPVISVKGDRLLSRVVRTGETAFEDPTDRGGTSSDVTTPHEQKGMSARIAVPLGTGDTVHAILIVSGLSSPDASPTQITTLRCAAEVFTALTEFERLLHEGEQTIQIQRLMLRELHHRVKNNLQMVSSLINLRALDGQGISNETVSELRTHIHALAATHDNLFQPGVSEDVRLTSFIEDIVGVVETGYQTRSKGIQVARSVAPDITCPMSVAVPLSLLVSELVLNAVKHAYPRGTSGTITVALRQTPSHLILTIEDDGYGMVDVQIASGSFGLTLVGTLAEQLHATTSCEAVHEGIPGRSRVGLRWEISIPSEEHP